MSDTPTTGPGSKSDEAKALLQLTAMFGAYPNATGLSHLMALVIRDAVRSRTAAGQRASDAAHLAGGEQIAEQLDAALNAVLDAHSDHGIGCASLTFDDAKSRACDCWMRDVARLVRPASAGEAHRTSSEGTR